MSRTRQQVPVGVVNIEWVSDNRVEPKRSAKMMTIRIDKDEALLIAPVCTVPRLNATQPAYAVIYDNTSAGYHSRAIMVQHGLSPS